MSSSRCRAARASAHSCRLSLYAESTRLCFTLLFVIMILASFRSMGAYSYFSVLVSRKMALSFLPMATANWSIIPQLQPFEIIFGVLADQCKIGHAQAGNMEQICENYTGKNFEGSRGGKSRNRSEYFPR